MKNVIVIPARFKSTRFPGKMLAPIQGKTLIRRTYENALLSRKGEKVIIAVDHPDVERHVKEFGAECFMTDPYHPNGTSRILEVVENCKDIAPEAVIINLQGDEPCLDPSVIDALFEMMHRNPDLPAATAATPLFDHEEALKPSVVKCVFDTRHRALYFSRRLIPYAETFEKAHKHMGIYAFRKSFLRIYCQLPDTPLGSSEN